MKRFKKKHNKLPSQETILRLLRRHNDRLVTKYLNYYPRTPEVIPVPIREVCLAEFDPNRRTNIRYFPDIHNFEIYDFPNRSLPVGKFLGLFRTVIDTASLDILEKALTDYRLVFYTQPDNWISVYADDTVETCESHKDTVRCYAHHENKLALATLYAPGGDTIVARSIVNTDEKWYVRLFGDSLLVSKLLELGYNRITRAPKAFKMYGVAGRNFTGTINLPYFDFPCTATQPLPDTHNPETGLVEVIINPGVR